MKPKDREFFENVVFTCLILLSVVFMTAVICKIVSFFFN